MHMMTPIPLFDSFTLSNTSNSDVIYALGFAVISPHFCQK